MNIEAFTKATIWYINSWNCVYHIVQVYCLFNWSQHKFCVLCMLLHISLLVYHSRLELPSTGRIVEARWLSLVSNESSKMDDTFSNVTGTRWTRVHACFCHTTVTESHPRQFCAQLPRHSLIFECQRLNCTWTLVYIHIMRSPIRCSLTCVQC